MSLADDLIVPTELEAPQPRPAARPRRARSPWLSRIVLLAILGVGGYFGYTLGLPWLRPAKTTITDLTYRVKRSDLLVTVTEDGNLESSNNVDIKCEVPGGSTILTIVTNGSHVKSSDELARLDSAAIEDQVNAQLINYEKAVAAKIEAETGFDAAKIALEEYEEGTFPQELQTIEANITVAKENLRSAENMFQHTERMARKGYVTTLQRDAQEFSVRRGKIDLDVAEKAKDVLERFTKAKMVGDLKSKADTAEAKMRSAEAQFELEKTRLDRLKRNLEKCVIVAPHDGLVEYANEPGGGRGGQPAVLIEEGATVRERQSILRMPDLSKMQVKVLIHETKIGDVRVGEKAVVKLQEQEMRGEVTFVANQAESPSWFAPNIRKYATIVRVDNPTADLRTGMTASVEILCADRRNVLAVPVQVVQGIGGQFFAWIKNGNVIEQRTVELGEKSLTQVEVTKGLKEGDEVLLDPTRFAEAAKRDTPVDLADKGTSRFGERGPAASPSHEKGAPVEPAVAKKNARPKLDPAALLKENDKDGDGKLSVDECPEGMKNFFSRVDTSGDGFVDRGELNEARKRMAARENGGGPPGGT